MGSKFNSRSLKYFRDRGYRAEMVERYSTHSGRSLDLFGFADMIAFDVNEAILVQITSRSNISARIRKITDDEEVNNCARAWLVREGRRIVVLGWDKIMVPCATRGAKNPEKGVWRPKEVELLLDLPRPGMVGSSQIVRGA